MRNSPKKRVLPLVSAFALVFVLIAFAVGSTSYADEMFDTGQGMNEAAQDEMFDTDQGMNEAAQEDVSEPEDDSSSDEQMTPGQGMEEDPAKDLNNNNEDSYNEERENEERENEVVISTLQELHDLSQALNSGLFAQTHGTDIQDAKITLKNDIDLGGGFEPIGNYLYPFTGEFDGGGFTIANLTIDNENESLQGLFGVVGVGGNVHDVNLTNVRINAYMFAGGVAGFVEFAKISNCTVSGDISAFDSYAGGIAGTMIESTIEKCTTSGTVSAYWSDVGGIVGNATGYNAVISDCSSSSQITVKGNAGGIVGNLAGADLHNCTFSGEIICMSDDYGNMFGYIDTEPLGDIKPMFDWNDDGDELPDLEIQKPEVPEAVFTTDGFSDGFPFDIFTPPFYYGEAFDDFMDNGGV